MATPLPAPPLDVTPPASEAAIIRRLFLLGCAFMGIELLWSIYNAYVPIFLQAGRPDFAKGAGVTGGFGLDAVTTGLIMTLDNVAALFMLPWVGALSDRLRTRIGRRKPFIAIGAPIAAVAFVAVPFALGTHVGFFMAAIVATFLAMNLFRCPVVALMPDITPSPQRSFANGIINTMGGLGSVIALLVGGWLFHVSARAPFAFGSAGMLVGIGLVLLFIREPTPEAAGPADEEPSLLGSFGQVLRDRDRSALLILAALFAWYLGHSAITVWFTSFAVNTLHVDSGQATQTVFFMSGALMVGSIPAGWIGARLGRRRTILTGLLLLAALYLVGLRLRSIEQARVLFSAIGFAWALVTVNALPMVVDCAPPARVGTYTGLYYLAAQSAQIAGPIISGFVIKLSGNDYRAVFPYIAATMLLAAGAMARVRKGGGEAR